MGRGCLPADHELAFSRARGAGLKGADVALVIGVPLDFRLGFGGCFGEETKIIRVDVAENELTANRAPEVDLVGNVAATLAALREAAGGDPSRTRPGSRSCASVEDEKRAGEREELDDERSPLHPVRVYRELNDVLDRDAIVIGDGGDFVSYAGRYIETYAPGCWMDPGPFGCLGAGPGQAIGAKVALPRPPGLPAARRRRLRLRRDRVRHDGPPRARRRRRDGQQRDLGARAPPDEVPLRLLGRGQAAARDPL